MRGRGFGRSPFGRSGGPPLFRSRSLGRTGGLLGLLGFLFPGLAGYWLGKRAAEAQQYAATSETELTQREAELTRREAELLRREQEQAPD